MTGNGTLRTKNLAAAIWLALVLLYSTPALTQDKSDGTDTPKCLTNSRSQWRPKPPQGVGIEAAAEMHDAAGAAYFQIAESIDTKNGREEPPIPPLSAQKYLKAADCDEKAAKQHAQAGKDWKEAADKYKAISDKYKAVAAALKDVNESERTRLKTMIADLGRKVKTLQKNAEDSNKWAVKAYKAGAAERQKATFEVSETDQFAAWDAAAKDREEAAHVSKASKDDGGDGEEE